MVAVDVWDAIIAQDAERVATSIARGAKVNQEGSGGQTPLHLAAECDAVDCLSVLLKHGADVNFEDESLRSPLIVACASASMRAARVLIDAGATVRASDENQVRGPPEDRLQDWCPPTRGRTGPRRAPPSRRGALTPLRSLRLRADDAAPLVRDARRDDPCGGPLRRRARDRGHRLQQSKKTSLY